MCKKKNNTHVISIGVKLHKLTTLCRKAPRKIKALDKYLSLFLWLTPRFRLAQKCSILLLLLHAKKEGWLPSHAPITPLHISHFFSFGWESAHTGPRHVPQWQTLAQEQRLDVGAEQPRETRQPPVHVRRF